MPSAEEILSDERLRELFQSSVRFVQKLAADGEQNFVPLARSLILNSDNSFDEAISSFRTIPDSPDRKRGLFYTAGHKLQREAQGIVAATTFHHEGWAVVGAENCVQGPRPSKHPERVEVLIITATSADGRTIGTAYELRRQTNGPVLLVPMKGMQAALSKPKDNGVRLENELMKAFFAGVATALRERL